jgi:hypothetical protein
VVTRLTHHRTVASRAAACWLLCIRSDSYIKKVPHRDIIKFTLVQLVALAVLYAVKSSPFGIACECSFIPPR